MKPAKHSANSHSISEPQNKNGKPKIKKTPETLGETRERVSPHSLFNLFTANIIKKNILR